MKYIEMDKWPRREHFALYYGMDSPQFNVTLEIDVTHFLSCVRGRHSSFYYSMCYAVSKIANESEALRYRIRDGKVVLHDTVYPSFTDLVRGGGDLFKIVTMDTLGEDMQDFVRIARERSEKQASFLDGGDTRDDLLYLTCTPWFSFTQITHPISFTKDDSVPRISWGKYFERDEKVWMPFSIQAHHALMDGYHVGKYVTALQNYLDQL